MAIFLRYAFLLALGLVSFFAFVSATTVTGQRMLADSGSVSASSATAVGMWILVAIATTSLFSMVRFVTSGVPAMARSWLSDNKDRLVTLVLASVVCVIFLMS